MLRDTDDWRRVFLSCGERFKKSVIPVWIDWSLIIWIDYLHCSAEHVCSSRIGFRRKPRFDLWKGSNKRRQDFWLHYTERDITYCSWGSGEKHFSRLPRTSWIDRNFRGLTKKDLASLQYKTPKRRQKILRNLSSDRTYIKRSVFFVTSFGDVILLGEENGTREECRLLESTKGRNHRSDIDLTGRVDLEAELPLLEGAVGRIGRRRAGRFGRSSSREEALLYNNTWSGQLTVTLGRLPYLFNYRRLVSFVDVVSYTVIVYVLFYV